MERLPAGRSDQSRPVARREPDLTPELPPWDAVIAPVATKTLRNEEQRILAAIERLPAGDVRRLQGRRDEWRLRVGNWRALIRLDQDGCLIVVTAIKPHGRAYDR